MTSKEQYMYGDNYPYLCLIYSEETIVLTKMHDENHPQPICIFPKEQYKTAQWLVEKLNGEKLGIPI